MDVNEAASGRADVPEGADMVEPVPAWGSLLATLGGHAGAIVRLPRLGRAGYWLLAGFVLVGWAASGIYKVAPDEQGVVLRFGHWIDTETPGLHYHLPAPIDAVLLPKVTNVNELRSTTIAARPVSGMPGAMRTSASRMLTGDENIVEADYSVLWKIKDAGAFLFRVEDPPGMIRMAAETSVRAVVGRSPIQAVLSDQREQIAVAVQDEMQHLLDHYGVGIEVLQVQLQRVDPPAAVIDAFNDVQRARADQVRSRNEAEAYRNDILPHARGQADNIVQDAEAYRTQAIDQAQGDVATFLAAWNAYREAPAVFAWRTYLDSMDAMLRRASRVVIDSSGKGVTSVVPYMPLAEAPKTAAAPGLPSAAAPPPPTAPVSMPTITPQVATP